MKEIEALKQLSHPNIIHTYEYFHDSEYVYIIMELCQAGSLFEILWNSQKFPKIYRQGKNYLEEDQVCSIMRQLLGAVQYANKKGIIHRDIKPDNIVMDVEEDGSL